MLNKNILQKIKQRATLIDWNQAFRGKSKGNKHLERIVKIAKFLGEKEKADLSIVETGAWLHDIALPTGNDEDYQKNIQLTTDFLKPFKITTEENLKIAKCVATHEGVIKPETLEAKIVHDADVLEKVGILGLIRQTWKLTNLGKIDPQNITNENVKEIRNHIQWRVGQIKTKSAKELVKTLNISLPFTKAKELIKKTSLLAAKGIITEKIAQIIFPNLNNKQQHFFKKQLHITKTLTDK